MGQAVVPWARAEAEGMEEMKDWITIQELESKGWVEAVTLQKGFKQTC